MGDLMLKPQSYSLIYSSLTASDLSLFAGFHPCIIARCLFTRKLFILTIQRGFPKARLENICNIMARKFSFHYCFNKCHQDTQWLLLFSLLACLCLASQLGGAGLASRGRPLRGELSVCTVCNLVIDGWPVQAVPSPLPHPYKDTQWFVCQVKMPGCRM